MGKPRPIKYAWLDMVMCSTMPPTRRVVAYGFSLFMDRDGGDCYPSHPRLAGRLGLSERTVERHAPALMRDGFLVARERHEKGTRGQSAYEYQAMIPPGYPAWDQISEADADCLRAIWDEWRSNQPPPRESGPSALAPASGGESCSPAPATGDASPRQSRRSAPATGDEQPPTHRRGLGAQEASTGNETEASPYGQSNSAIEQRPRTAPEPAPASRGESYDDGDGDPPTPSGPRPDDDGRFRCGCGAVVGGPRILCVACREDGALLNAPLGEKSEPDPATLDEAREAAP